MESIETSVQKPLTPPLKLSEIEEETTGVAHNVSVVSTSTVARENRDATVGEVRVDEPRIRCTDVDVYYGDKRAINSVSLDIGKNEVIALIGPSGCGKSTFLRCLNRMNDTIDGCRVTGNIVMDDMDINDSRIDVVPLRAQVGMVFQKPNPFPKSIWENIAFGARIHGLAQDKY